MRLELREFASEEHSMAKQRKLVLVAENKNESRLMDYVFGSQVDLDKSGFISEVKGELRLSDGFREHYLILERDNG